MKYIILPSDPLNNKIPHEMYQKEFEAASKFFNVVLFNLHDLQNIRTVLDTLPKNNDVEKQVILYHGWMMNQKDYQKLSNILLEKNYKLVNDTKQYMNCYHFDGWYPAVKDFTPLSWILLGNNVSEMSKAVLSFQEENDCDIIIKDYVSSLKHLWKEACFISKNYDVVDKVKVIQKFLNIKEQMNNFNEGLVIRKFLDFKKIGTDENDMPMSHEYRSFILNGKVIDTIPYWDSVKYEGSPPPTSFIEKLARDISNHTKSNFFTIDTVLSADERLWYCIEVGDGQVCSFPEQRDLDNFFERLSENV